MLLWRWTLLKSYNLCMVATTFNSNEAFIISRLANAAAAAAAMALVCRRRHARRARLARRCGARLPQPPRPPRPLLCPVLLQGVYIATLPNEVAK